MKRRKLMLGCLFIVTGWGSLVAGQMGNEITQPTTEPSGEIIMTSNEREQSRQTGSASTQSGKPRDLVVTRRFNAPVELVWQAWSESERVKQWWGPHGFSAPVAQMDFREGGTSLVCMRSPEGQEFYNTWTYRRIAPLQLIEFILDWADKDGRKIDPVKLGLPPEIPREVRHVITFTVKGENLTEMTVTEFGYTSDQMFDLSKAGLEQCLDKMAASLAKVVK